MRFLKGTGLKGDETREIKVASGIFGVVGAQTLVTQRVLAHTGHDHSRSGSADESTATDDEKGSVNDSESGTEEENLAETNVPTQEVPVVDAVPATAAAAGMLGLCF